MRRVLRGAAIAVPFFALKAALLTRLVGSFFFTLHLAYVFGVVLVPAAGLAVLCAARGARSTPAVKRFAAAALVPAALATGVRSSSPTGWSARPSRSSSIRADPARARCASPSWPTCRAARSTTTCARPCAARSTSSPHLILLPGDLMQCTGPGHRERAVVEFRELLAPLSAPLGVWFVMGNCDWPPTVARAFEGTAVRILQNESVRLAHGEGSVVLAGADFGERAAEFAGRARRRTWASRSSCCSRRTTRTRPSTCPRIRAWT